MLRAHEGRAVAELAAVVDLRGDPRHLLQQELAHERGVPARAAGQEHHALRLLAGRPPRPAQLLEVDLALLEADPAEQRVAHRPRLLVDLLEHEVAVAALLRLHGVPGDALGLAAPRAAPGASVMLDARPGVTVTTSPSSRKTKSRV